MAQMFGYAKSFNQPLNNWDVSNVTHMGSMFGYAKSFNQPLNNWDVSSVTLMFGMFSEAGSFNQPIGDWAVSSVTDKGGMFRNGNEKMIEKYGVDGEKLRSFSNKKNNETGDIKDYGITRRVDIYEDNEGDEYYLIVYLLIRLYDDQDELEGYELEGDIIEDIFEFTVAIKNNSIVQEGLDLEFIEPYGEDTCTFEHMEDFFERDVKEYGTELETLINIGELKSEILKKYIT